uniref:Uncharacterized protein n=1 Tax=Xiphophorus couchianus TaxID=32473 RepID=A0A3B5L1B7_9TELE
LGRFQRHMQTHLLVLLCPSGKITATKNSPTTIPNSIHTHTLGLEEITFSLGLVLLHSSSYLIFLLIFKQKSSGKQIILFLIMYAHVFSVLLTGF